MQDLHQELPRARRHTNEAKQEGSHQPGTVQGLLPLRFGLSEKGVEQRGRIMLKPSLLCVKEVAIGGG